MPSSIQVDKIIDSGSTSNKELAEYSSGNWGWGKGVPSGTVLQVQQAVKDTHETYTSADGGDSRFQDITGTDQGGTGSIFCCKITPSATSSKIMITACMSMGSEDYSGYFKFMKKVGSGSYADITSAIGTLKTGSWSQGSFANVAGSTEDSEMNTSTMLYLDSPNTISEVHYKLQGTTRHGDTWSINRVEVNTDHTYHWTTISTLTLWEVAG